MPVSLPSSSDALIGPVREFLANPNQEGMFVVCEGDGVDLVLQVVAESPAGLVADCAGCGHRVRFERGKVDVTRACPLCRATLGPLTAAREGEKHNVFAWRVAWTKVGFAGLGHGPTVDEGVFTDADVLAGISQMHSVLRLYLPLFEDLNVTNMKDYRAAVKMRAEAAKAVEVGLTATTRAREGASA